MLRIHKIKSGQSTAEYTFLIVIILAVFLSMGTYARRGLQGRWKVSVDQMGEQYDPRFAVSNITHAVISNTTMEILAVNETTGWWTSRTDRSNIIETRTGHSVTGAY